MAKIFKRQKRTRHGSAFWDSEYSNPEHLALSDNASEDLMKFCRWLERETKGTRANVTASAIDMGCGNGRNLVYLAREYGMRGIGYDSSSAAIREAKRLSADLPLRYEVRSIAGAISEANDSQTIALDMMSSHFLKADDRRLLRDELHRVLKPGGYLFMKTFVSDGDLHTKRLLAEHPGPEPGTYMHPVIGVPEYAYSEAELVDFLSEKFTVLKTYLSHKHVSHGKARKRRTISVYAEKDPYKR